MTRKRPPRLSEDDLAIWRRVAQTAVPLKPAAKTLAAEATTPPPAAFPPTGPVRVPKPPASAARASFRIGEAAVDDHSGSHDLLPTIEARLAALPVRMDRKTFQKMKRGRLRPERSLDLHGMTLAQAHPALMGFILSAHAEGLRLVTVITGKGKTRPDDDGPIPTPRGVLRHHVPAWLQAAPLSAVILQVTDAHLRHGGSGAYYIYLRRRG